MNIKFKSLLLSIVFFVLLGSIVFLLLPFLATSYLLPHFLDTLPIHHKEVQITQLTHNNVSGRVYLSGKDRVLLTVPRFNIKYSYKDLLKRQLQSLEIEGASLEATLKDGKLSFDEIELQTANTSSSGNSDFLFPINLESLILKNCHLVIHRSSSEKTHLIIDAELTIQLQKMRKGYHLNSGKGMVAFSGVTPLTLHFSIEQSATGYDISIEGKAFSIAKLIDPFSQIDDIKGSALFNIQSSLDTSPLRLADFNIHISLLEFLLRHRNVDLKNRSQHQPTTIKIHGNSHSAEYSLNGLSVYYSQKVSMQAKGMISKSSQMVHTAGTLKLIPEGSEDAENILALPVLSSFTAELFPPQKYFKASLQFQTFGEDNFRFNHHTTELLAAPLHVTIHGTKEKKGSSLNLTLESQDISINNNEFSFHLPQFQLLGYLQESNGSFEGRISGSLPEINYLNTTISLRDIEFLYPLRYPLSMDSADEGIFNIKKIHAFTTNIASLTINSISTSKGLNFSGTIDNQHIQEMQLQFSGEIDRDLNLDAKYSLSPTTFSSGLLPATLPFPESLDVEGELALQGTFSYKNRKPGGTLSGSFSQGKLTMEDKNLTIAGINLDLHLPDLPKIGSSPSQRFTVETIDFGSFHITDGHIRYRLEDPSNLFIEKSRFSWCKGKIESGSMRLSTKKPAFETTLYCDRLSFSELLSQFNITDTEGEGSLNGKLPIFLSDSGLNVDGGFLFSTPGKSGIIKFNNTSLIMDSMPTVDKAGYLDYSVQALENFAYNWTKLTFSHRGDDLLLAMQIDGKPAEPLLFSFQQGQMIQSSKGPGIQHPIRLDVNFIFPLNDMFKYGHNIQSIMENM